MSKQVAIEVKDLTKVYQLYNNPKDRLKEALNPFKKSYHHDFYAMSDVNFKIYKGETVGIIGKNGAGKSTLLKMITGVLTPSKGEINTYGTISSLLELGAGFNPEMTGLENIFLNGTLMGFSKEQMEKKVDAILEFADIGEFIHQPVKMYSSGMFARLAFSVSINVEPDILIVDEALSVGDMAFQMKCYKKFQEFQEQKRTILFVTHALDSVIRYCNRGIVIDEGKLIHDSSPKEAVDVFKKVLTNRYYDSIKEDNSSKAQQQDSTELLKSNFTQSAELDVYGNGKADIYAFCYILESRNKELFKNFLEKVFIHFSSFVNRNSDININHKEIVVYLAKQKGIKLKESFGEDEKEAYFSLKIDDKSITFKGKSIKSLRKKVYKKALEIV
jgi:teichoic acid transport system ATP-binding protein